MTRLCVAIFVTDKAAARQQIKKAIAAGADCVELRIDSIDSQIILRQILTPKPRIPFIVTCRSFMEGGQSTLNPAQRMELMDMALKLGAESVDFELQSADGLNLPKNLILSSHDFQNKPKDIQDRVQKLNQTPCDVAKIVWSAHSIVDNLSAFQILQNKAKPTVALCMNEAGLISRVLAKKFDAYLTFCTLPDDPGTAPGQISIGQMKKLYRWDAIKSDTKVYGVVGYPISHSKSPLLHNAAFEDKGINAVYLPMLVTPSYESFKEFLDGFLAFKPLQLSGLSVTIPHKANALRYLEEHHFPVDPLAKSIGAVNTLQVLENGTVKGGNTDYPAILGALEEAMNISLDKLKNKTVAIIGAGGVARSAVAGLHHLGAKVTIYNRTLDRAVKLANDFHDAVAMPLEQIASSRCDIYINCTCVGMHPHVDQSPIGDSPLKGWNSNTVVFDIIYNPAMTKLIQQAQSVGAKTILGAEMFLRQAALQFSQWTGHWPSTSLWRKLLA
jgi:3-dehydroquinate dehydratase / shikimate dehydrogenase